MTLYRTIVADPPWPIAPIPTTRIPAGAVHDGRRSRLPYQTMTVDAIASLPVRSLADADAHLYLWTINRYVDDAFDVARSWGFRFSTLLTWAKTPKGIIGGTFTNSAEYILFCRRGSLQASRKVDTSWWNWPRCFPHSRKPDAFLDLVESVSPGPYVELFARRNRLGWDTWGAESIDHLDTEWTQSGHPPLAKRLVEPKGTL